MTMPTDAESQMDLFYDMLKRQPEYIDEEHVVEYDESELVTLSDIVRDREDESLSEDK